MERCDTCAKNLFGTLEPCVYVTRMKMCKCDCARAMCRKMCVRQVSVCTRVYWERGLLQSCSLFQDRKILLHLTQNLLCSVNPEFQSTIDSQSWDPLLMHGQFINSCFYCSICFLRNKFFSTFQHLGNLLLDVLGRVYSSFPILHSSYFLISLSLIRLLIRLVWL